MNVSRSILPGLLLLTLLLSACADAVAPVSSATPAHTATVEESGSQPEETQPTVLSCDDPFEGETVRFSTSYWPKTDFCRHNVPYSEILAGGALPPDGIPAIDSPRFESITAGNAWLGDDWPVLVFEFNGDARAYPLAILTWHEIVNDTVGGEPVALTFCPLCNASIVFRRTLSDGRTLTFGTSGNLRNSDLVMYDRETQSWWQQFTGEAIVGALTDTRLVVLPSQIAAWGEFKQAFPDGLVLSRDTGHSRAYGRNPYPGYDSVDSLPFFPVAGNDDRLPAMARVAAILVEGQSSAYPFSTLAEIQVVNDQVNGLDVAIFWSNQSLSALDSGDMAVSRAVGSAAAYATDIAGRTLHFEALGAGWFTDTETGSRWNIFGVAVEGELAGTRLTPIPAGEYFWFSWAAFQPDTRIWSP